MTAVEQMVAEMLQEVHLLRQKVDRQSQQIDRLLEGNPSVTADGWVKPSVAAEKLMAIGIKSESHLKALRHKGILSERNGCTRDISKGDRPTWQYYLPNCRTVLERYFKEL